MIQEEGLAIRLAGSEYALRLAEVAGLFSDRKVVPVPGPDPEFLGIAGLRGSIVPVWDLRLLMGLAGDLPPRWLVLARTSDPVALAFDHFEARLRCLRAEVPRPLVDIASVVAAITRKSCPDRPLPSPGQNEE